MQHAYSAEGLGDAAQLQGGHVAVPTLIPLRGHHFVGTSVACGHYRICFVTSGSSLSMLDLSSNPPPVLISSPLKPYCLVRHSWRIPMKPCNHSCWSMTRLMYPSLMPLTV